MYDETRNKPAPSEKKTLLQRVKNNWTTLLVASVLSAIGILSADQARRNPSDSIAPPDNLPTGTATYDPEVGRYPDPTSVGEAAEVEIDGQKHVIAVPAGPVPTADIPHPAPSPEQTQNE